MATGVTHAGLTIEVSTASPATYDTAGFGALTYTEVGQVISFGDFGREYADVATKVLAERGTVHTKGTFDEGTLSMTLLDLTTDAGQILLNDGASGAQIDTNHSFQITYNNGEVFHFQALIASYRIIGGDGDTNRTAQSNLFLDTRGVVKS